MNCGRAGVAILVESVAILEGGGSGLEGLGSFPLALPRLWGDRLFFLVLDLTLYGLAGFFLRDTGENALRADRPLLVRGVAGPEDDLGTPRWSRPN